MVFRIILISLLFLSSSSVFAKGGTIGLGVRGGMIMTPLPGYGVDVFYTGSKNFTLGLNYTTGSFDFLPVLESESDDYASTELKKANVSASFAMVEARYFLFWGVNIFGGLGMRTITMELDIEDTALDAALDTKVQAQSVVSNVGLGVMGRWDSFYLSLDLLAVTTPSSSKVTAESTATGAFVEGSDLSELNDELVKAGEDLGAMPSLQLLNLGIGFIF